MFGRWPSTNGRGSVRSVIVRHHSSGLVAGMSAFPGTVPAKVWDPCAPSWKTATLAAETPRDWGANLLTETEPGYERAVAIDIFTIKVVEQSAALTDQLQQASSGAVVVRVLSQMFG